MGSLMKGTYVRSCKELVIGGRYIVRERYCTVMAGE